MIPLGTFLTAYLWFLVMQPLDPGLPFQPIASSCAIPRAAYDAHMAEAKHPHIADVEPNLVLPLIEFINKVPPESHFQADSVATYEMLTADFIRVAFFWKGCFVDDVTSGRAGFLVVLKAIAAKQNNL